MRGRKPTPTKLKILRGNPGKREINRKEPKPKPPQKDKKTGAPKLAPPAYLAEPAKKLFKETLKAAPEGLLTKLDRALLGRWCQNECRIAELEKTLREMGMTFTTEKGYVCQRPELTMINTIQKTQVRMEAEMGFTPSSRSRIEIDVPEEEDKAEEFLFGKRSRTA